jgi:hypothetical protein
MEFRWWRRRAPSLTAETASATDNLKLKAENAELRAALCSFQAQQAQAQLALVRSEMHAAHTVVAVLARRSGGLIRIPQSEALDLGKWNLTSRTEPGSGDNLIELHEEVVN